MSTQKTIFISAGEVSGDHYGADLARAIQKIDPTIRLIGMGSNEMKKAGVDVKLDISHTSSIGILEPLKYISTFFNSNKTLNQVFEEENIDLYVPIDCQGVHMVALKKVKKHNIPATYFIAPQEWHWGTENGGRKVINLVDKIIGIFPEEAKFYKKLGADSHYFGHPIIDRVKVSKTKETLCAALNLDPTKPIFSVFPGSRWQEINRVSPVLIAAAKQIKKACPEIQLVVSLVKDEFESVLTEQLKDADLDVTWYKGASADLIAHTHFSLVTSGTITLEHAIFGVPCLVAYKFSPLTYQIGTYVMKKRLGRIPYMSLPNMIMDDEIIPEFFQDQASSSGIASLAIKYLTDENSYQKLKSGLLTVKETLGKPGVMDRVAREICSAL